LAGSPAALGKNLTLNGIDHTIVGVLRPEFRFGDQRADVYTPIARRNPLYMSDRTVHDILCVARLRPEVSLGQALAEMNTVQEHIDELNPTTERGLGAYVIPLKKSLVGDVGGTLLLLLGAVGLVLLIATANVANLLLARSAARTREFAIRLALGASRAQIMRQLCSPRVCSSPSLADFWAWRSRNGASKPCWRRRREALPRIENIGVNTPVLLYAFGVSVIVGIVFGLFPALKSAKTDVQMGLAEGGRGTVGGHQRIQNVLAVLQVALALVLLTGGSLLFRTIRNLWTVNPGFNPQHVLTFQIGFRRQRRARHREIRIAYQSVGRAHPPDSGCRSGGYYGARATRQAYNEGPFWVGPHQPASMAEIPRAIYYPTGPGYVRNNANTAS
jgi:hypothetical protein